ncbi:MAG: MgtC/SapB family protein [Plectolyngbya sp. WJT66-NPBG17]|jgi:putative Mg2+ transporter-C (MgtC) family protein|nr:MgtC/SapB family protein [Plectolyngbya sp. WJT66-NPBG17]MBW4526161.1 MgtC/SapB family protein [Phormidium tanganyikae FI6-MK23]
MVNYSIDIHNWGGLLVRLGSALLAGGAIGWERQQRHKSAGLRTHMLVSLGAALFVLVPIEVSGSAEGLSRTIQGVAAGVGFLGAGEILHRSRPNGRNQEVKGLTSAASIWVTAALGITAGAGLWQLTVLGTLLTLLTLVGVKRLEQTSLISKRDDSEE